MNALKNVEYSPLNYNEKIIASFDGKNVRTTDVKGNEVYSLVTLNDSKLELSFEGNNVRNDDLLELVAIEYLLGHNENLKSVSVKENRSYEVLETLKKETGLIFSRGEFFELRAPWYKERFYTAGNSEYIYTKDLLHPKRSNPQSGVLYSRYIPAMEKTISFRVIDLDRDLETFSNWHNQDRVNNFWELKGSKEDHINYIKKLLDDNHMIPTIAEIDGEAYGYFELYWAYEDRLGPYYPSTLFDRGFHFLIGNAKFLGAINTDSALKSLVHLTFLEDARTTKLMAEPRVDNAKVIKYVDSFPVWKRLYEFDFPHKRALLIEARREVFFTRDFL